MSPEVLRDMARQKLAADFKVLVGRNEIPKEGYVGGVPFTGYQTNFGYLPFIWSIFLDQVQGRTGLAASETGAPAAAASIAAAVGDATSLLPAGDYRYWVSAINDDGESLITACASNAVTIAAAQRCTVTITQVAGATGYRIYRQPVDEGVDILANARIVDTVPDSGAATTLFLDRNQNRIDTGWAFIVSGVKDSFNIAELAPLMKWMLYPTTTTTQEFILLLIHVFAKKVWERCVFWRNIGVYSEP